MSYTRTAEFVVSRLYNKDNISVSDLYQILTGNGRDFDYDVNAVTMRSSSSALHAACAKGNAPVVRILLKMGANPNQKDFGSESHTALFTALEAGSVECVKLLIEHGARLDHIWDSYTKRTYLNYALKLCKNVDIRSYIESQLDRLKLRVPEDFTGISFDELTQALNDFSLALDKRDFNTASDICSKYPIDIHCQTIVTNLYEKHFKPAIEKGDLETVQFYVERGSYVTGSGDHYTKTTLPDLARKSGHENVAAYLESVQKQRYEILKAELANELKPVQSPTLFGTHKTIPANPDETASNTSESLKRVAP